MSSSVSSPKPIKKVSSDNSSLSFDLLTNLTYMAALSLGETSRDVVFQRVMAQPFKTAIYFKQVFLLTKRLGFEYSTSFALVSQKAGAPIVKSFLLRYAGAISSGESEGEFLAQEASVERELYASTYERAVETLQKWGDAYAALLVSVTLIVVVALISTMLTPFGDAFILMLTGASFMITGVGVYIIYRSAPQEKTSYKGLKGPWERRRAVQLCKIMFPFGLLAGGYLTYTSGLGMGLLALGLSLIPIGFYAYKDDAKVSKIDQELPNFIRALGNVSGALGATLSVAMSKIDRRAMGATLEPHITRLQIRLQSQIAPEVCWESFKDEVGSELVSRTSSMFVDGTSLGGAPERVGEISAKYALTIAMLRGKRQVAALPFAYLVVPLHGAMTALLIFVLEIMRSFNERLIVATRDLSASSSEGLSKIPDLPVFQPSERGLVGTLVIIMVLVLTVANSFSPKFATGGHPLNVAFYGSIMCILTGLNLILIPPVAAGLLVV